MTLISSKCMAGIVCRALDHVDSRLVSHGKRVAYMMQKMLDEAGGFDPVTIRNISLIAMIHDIGAYKTEEINNMIRFETENIWDHSIYGYLFIRDLSPLKDYAKVVLYHHASYDISKSLDSQYKLFAQMLKLADRIDVFMATERREGLMDFIGRGRDRLCSAQVVDLFFSAQKHYGMLERLATEGFWEEAMEILDQVPFTQEEIDMYLKMLTYTIDFRSEYTVMHTITTTAISIELGKLLGLGPRSQEQLRYGALLHDLGKIGIPVEILEFPGKLSPQAMAVMKTHVDLTQQILGGDLDLDLLHIALRHHEKLDGSGYPRGLAGDQLSLSERIVAVADVVSALRGKRSYKEAFGKEKITAILEGERDGGRLCPVVANGLLSHYDPVMEQVDHNCRPILEAYRGIWRHYQEQRKWYAQQALKTEGPA